MNKMVRVLNGLLNGIITVIFSSMVLLVFVNVVLRYVLDSGITWSEEFARFLFVYIVFLGAIVAHKEKAHLGVDLLVGSLPLGLQKAVYALINFIVIAVLYLFVDGALKMYQLNINNFAPATGISLSVLYVAGIAAGIIMIVISAVQTIQFVWFNKNAPSWAKSEAHDSSKEDRSS
ncbi:putative TRAP transporter small permease protein [Caldalkalibacillus thermarum]|uniref:TRAP transporter small permease n=1 Tax=Caldalkalibacillus thermarum TaxID=296745 RepID=UPI00166386F5|nr:TRAP transporter small permease [Caldalkalibacillus thermarum]GGK34421.1 putative TRAP transporter small permease protein [Caldalkalibacillus thermarum]